VTVTKRGLWYAVTQPRVLTYWAIGAGLLFWGAPPTAAAVLFFIGALKAARVLRHDDLDDRLRLQTQKRNHGIRRMLRNVEREEILAIDHYAKMLRETGADPSLADEALAEGWKIVRSAGRNDASARLKVYRHNLPALRQPELAAADEPMGIANKIQRELSLVRAAERELELVG